MFDNIERLMVLGIDVTFSRNHINMFDITLTKNKDISESVSSPFDHLTETKIIKYINFMENKLL